MWLILGLGGFLGFLICLILLIVRAFKGDPKKPMVLGLLACIILFAIGVSLTPSSNAEKDGKLGETTTPPSESEQNAPTPEPSLETNATETAEQTSSTGSNLVGTDLFEEVYVPFALWEKARLFEGVKVFAQNCGYAYEVTEASENSVASAKFFSGDDYVYVAYAPDVEDIEIMMTVSYYQGSSNSEVSMSNYSTGRDRAYDKFQTHVIGEQSNDVDGIEAQREFLFSE